MTTKENKLQRRKTRKGGMSAARYDRQRNEQLKQFFREAGESLNKELLPILEEIDAIVMGGNTIRAKEFVKKSKLDLRLLAKIYPEYVSTSQVDKHGLHEAIKAISRLPIHEELRDEKDVWDEFMRLLMKNDKRAIYGEKEVREAMEERGYLEKILIHEDTIFNVYTMSSPKVIVFSRETEPGEQLKGFGGVAAIAGW
jgi:peptide subunit release factor 1 (eRF1)